MCVYGVFTVNNCTVGVITASSGVAKGDVGACPLDVNAFVVHGDFILGYVVLVQNWVLVVISYIM